MSDPQPALYGMNAKKLRESKPYRQMDPMHHTSALLNFQYGNAKAEKLEQAMDLRDGQQMTLALMYVGNLTIEGRSRLMHARLAHPSYDSVVTMYHHGLMKNLDSMKRLNKDCVCCAQGKFKRGVFPARSDELKGKKLAPWEKVYFDGWTPGKDHPTVGGGTSALLFVDARGHGWFNHT